MPSVKKLWCKAITEVAAAISANPSPDEEQAAEDEDMGPVFISTLKFLKTQCKHLLKSIYLLVSAGRKRKTSIFVLRCETWNQTMKQRKSNWKAKFIIAPN